MTKLITRSCLRLLLGRRKLISPGDANLQGLSGTAVDSPEFGQNLASILPNYSLPFKLYSHPVAPKVVLQPRGVNSRVGLQYKIQALGVPLTNLARDKSTASGGSGGSLSTRGPRARSWLRSRGKRGIVCVR